MNSTSSTVTLTLSREVFRRWYLVLAASAIVLIATLLLPANTLPLTSDQLIWLDLLAIYVVFALHQVTDQTPQGSLIGLPLALLAVFLAQGLTAALGLILAGSLLAGAVQFLFASGKRLPRRQKSRIVARKMLVEVVVMGGSLLAGAAAYWLAGGHIPLVTLTPTDMVMIFVLLVVLLIVRNLAWRLLAPQQNGEATRIEVVYSVSYDILVDSILSIPAVTISLNIHRAFNTSLVVIFWVLILGAVALRALSLSRASLHHRIEELALLNIVSKALATASTTTDLFGTLYVQVSRLLDAPVFYIAMRDLAAQHITFPLVVRNGQRITWPIRPLGNGPTETVLQERHALLSVDGSEPIFAHPGSPFGDLTEPCSAYLGVPIRTPEGLNGVLAVQHPTRKWAFTDADANLLETIAAQVGAALRNTNLVDVARQFSEGLMLVNHVSNIINASLETEIILQQICTVAQDLSHASSAAIFLKSDQTMRFEPVYSINFAEGLLAGLAKSTADQEEQWAILLSKPETLCIPNLETDRQMAWLYPLLQGTGIQSMTLTPFISVRNLLNERTLSPTRDLIGFQIAFYQSTHVATQNERHLMQMLANQAAVAIENANLFEETQNTVRRLAYLAEATRIFTESLEMDKVAQSIVDWIVDALNLDTATLVIWNKAENRLQVRAHARSYQMPLNTPAPDFSARTLDRFPEAHQTMQGRWSQVFPAADDTLSPVMRQIFTQTGLQMVVFTPLTVRDDVIGLLALGTRAPNPIPAHDINLAEAIASQAATALQNARFYALTETQLSDRITEISVLEEVVRRIAASVDERAIIEDVLDAAHAITGADMLSCALTTHHNTLNIIWRFVDSPHVTHQQEYPETTQSVIGQALRSGQPVIVADTGVVDNYWNPEGSRGFRSEICVPIMHREQPLGVLNLESLELDKFTEAHLRFLQNLAGHAAIALERARLFASNQRQIVLLDAIRQLSLDLLDSPDMDTVLGHVCATALSITRGVNVHIYFYNRATHTLEFAASLWTDGRRNVQIAIPRPNGLTMQGLDSDRPIISDDFERIPGVPTERLGIFPIRHYGQTVGALNVAVTDPTSMDEATIRALELLTNQAASAIERVRLSENRQNQIQLLEALRRSSVEMMGAMNPGQLMELVCRSALLMARAEDVHLYAYNKATDQVTFGASLWQDGRRNIEVSPPRQDGITYRTARSGEIQQIFAGDIPVNRDEPYVEMIAGIPLKHGDQVVGVLNVAVTNATDLNEDGIRALQLLASQSAAALLTARLYEEVRAGRDQMQVILNTARDGMALIGRAGQLLHMNPAAEQLLDVNLRPYLGKSLLQSVWETRRKYAPEDFRHANNLKAVWRILRDDPYQITHRQIHLEVRGQIKYLEEESAPVLAENGDPIGRLFVWHDVTEAQQLEKARNELTNTIIHDLRSPLTAIKGGLNMLPDIIGDPDELEIAHEILHIAENSTDGLLNLVESLLDVARLESGEMPLEITMTPLAEPVAEATQLLEILARDSQVALIADLPPDLPPLSIDADKVRRVLINLIDNALHYTPPGGRVLVKAAISDADPNTALITVEDSGPGIPPDIRDHVFTPFATGITGNPERKHRGLGLGLTFCKLAVEAHGGRIWIEDGLDGGAAFCFTLPISQ